MKLRASLLAFALSLSAASYAQDTLVPLQARKALELTVYESGLSLVKDQREFTLPRTPTTLVFQGVSAQLQADSVLFRTLTGDPLKIVEQSFDFDVLSQQALLQRAVGKEVEVHITNPATGRDTVERAKVLAVDQGLVLEIGGKIHTQVPGRIVFDNELGSLRTTPTLLITAEGKAGAALRTELGYLTTGLGWRTNYVAEYDADARRLDLSAWATITNSSGTDFKDAKIKLVSGQINRVQSAPQPMMFKSRRANAPEMAMAAAAPAADVVQQDFGGYHLYDIDKPVSIENNRTKQLSLLTGANIAAKQEYTVRGEPYYFQQQMPERPPVTQAESSITLKNDKASGLGLPLPAGVMRVYGQDETGAPQLLGEVPVAHTAEGGELRLAVGRDFDLTAEREQKSYVRASDRLTLVTWRVTLKNAKAKPAPVRVIEPIFGSFEISKESHPRDKTNAQGAEWLITVPAKGQTVLEYSAKITM